MVMVYYVVKMSTEVSMLMLCLRIPLRTARGTPVVSAWLLSLLS